MVRLEEVDIGLALADAIRLPAFSERCHLPKAGGNATETIGKRLETAGNGGGRAVSDFIGAPSPTSSALTTARLRGLRVSLPNKSVHSATQYYLIETSLNSGRKLVWNVVLFGGARAAKE